MAALLKQSTAVTIRLGPALDATDGVTEETTLSPTVEVSKNHGAFAARNSATAIAHDSNGWYAVELDATDTGTLGPLIAKFDDAATHLPVWREFLVVPANVYDSLVGGTDKLEVDTTQISGTAQTANDVGADVEAILVDTGTTLQAELDGIQADTEDIQTRLPAALVGGRMDSDMSAISGDATAADNLEAATETNVVGAVVDNLANSTTTFETNLTEATDDHYNGRILIFRTGALAGQATDITDYDGTTKFVTCTALTEEPAAGDTFVIV